MTQDFESEDVPYPTSPGRIRMLRILALGLGVLLFLMLVVALTL